MNGDTYSSRGMASTSTLPRIRKQETTTNVASATDRISSSRDHYVSSLYSLALTLGTLLTTVCRVHEMIVETEIGTESGNGVEIVVARGPPVIEVQDPHDAKPR